jgi:hypothetical protein
VFVLDPVDDVGEQRVAIAKLAGDRVDVLQAATLVFHRTTAGHGSLRPGMRVTVMRCAGRVTVTRDPEAVAGFLRSARS